MLKTLLLWTKEPLDSCGRPISIAPLPRGVKEYSYGDLETSPGTSFIVKKNIKYPPPPPNKGVGVSSELCLCEVGAHLKVGTSVLSNCFIRN